MGGRKRHRPGALHATRAREQELARTSSRVQEIGATLRPSASSLTAASRREEVDGRVRAKFAPGRLLWRDARMNYGEGEFVARHLSCFDLDGHVTMLASYDVMSQKFI